MNNKINVDFSSGFQNKVLLHTLVWLLFFSHPVYNIIFNSNTFDTNFIFIIFLCISIFYINFGFLVPKYMIKKKWLFFLLFLLLLLIIHCIIFLHIEPFAPNIRNQKINLIELKDSFQFRVFPAVSLFILMISVSSFLKIYELWNENFKRQKNIETENRTTELNFLKSQLNPHFFFNSLNTIYSLSISKSPKTSEAILNLSDLMRYMLGDKKDISIHNKVKLIDEINYITNYIELQKLRITPNNKIVFHCEGKMETILIYPLLFISFIENAFKFGVHPTDDSTISITFKVDKNFLFFEIKNNVQFQKNSYDSFGLGNENSIKRLNLFYPSNQLSITKKSQYIVTLKIDLNEN